MNRDISLLLLSGLGITGHACEGWKRWFSLVPGYGMIAKPVASMKSGSGLNQNSESSRGEKRGKRKLKATRATAEHV